MPAVRVVLVEPKNEGNVGAVARAMKNFGARDLVLVGPCPLGEEARKRAKHGVSVLEAARIARDFDAAVEGVDLTDGLVALVFGREDFGLLDDELRRCDLLVTIPASAEYPILNLSHAAAILLYELHAGTAPGRARRKASGLEKEKLHEALADLMEATQYPAHKRERTKIMFRRLIGRAVPSKWEFHALMGVLQRATKRIERGPTERRPPEARGGPPP